MFHRTQALVYEDRADDIAWLLRIAKLVADDRKEAALGELTMLTDRLQRAQVPKLEDYDQRVHEVRAG